MLLRITADPRLIKARMQDIIVVTATAFCGTDVRGCTYYNILLAYDTEVALALS